MQASISTKRKRENGSLCAKDSRRGAKRLPTEEAFFLNRQQPHTATKLAVWMDILLGWLCMAINIMSSGKRQGLIRIVDLFSGPGMHGDSLGSPLLSIETLLNLDLFRSKKVRVHFDFGDRWQAHTDTLLGELDARFANHPQRHNPGEESSSAIEGGIFSYSVHTKTAEELLDRPPCIYLQSSCFWLPSLRASSEQPLTQACSCVYLGPENNGHAFRLYNPETKKVFISRNCLFDESISPIWINRTDFNLPL